MKKPTSSKPKKNQTESALIDKLGKIGSLGKKTDKSSQKKLAKQDKAHQGVVLIGGLQDVQRFWIIWVVMAIFFVVLFARAFWIQVVNAQFYINKANEFITFRQNMPVQRGMILDTNGIPLAGNAPLVTVVFSPHSYAETYYINKRELQKAQSEKSKQRYREALEKMDLTRLASVSNIPKKTLEEAVKIDESIDVSDKEAIKKALPKGHGSKRMVIFNKTTPEIAETVTALKFAGISTEKHEKRFYLQPEPNAQILGYMSDVVKDNKKTVYEGRTGIELTYNERLAGKAGQMLMLKGNRTSIEEVKETRPKTDGETISLTLDSRLQYILYKELVELGRTQSARSSAGMVVDVLTGDVIAMSSWPSYNSNNLSELNGTNERNRPVMDTIEPGSVMKPFTVAAALDSGKYNVNTLIHTSPGSMAVAGHTIKDAGNYGSITMAKLIQKSSNIGSAKIALNLPPSAIADIQTRFGFGKKTNLNLAGEKAGVVRTPKASEKALRATMAYGYGQEVTLAQIAQAYATLGNHGVMRPLRLIKNDPAPEPVRVISEAHAQSIVAMMQSVTEEGGTGTTARINGYHVAGKTGTSRRAHPTKKGYAEGQYRNIFAGVAPATNPRFAVVILVEDPQKAKYAGQTVAPVFANVMKETLRLYNVPFDKPLDDAL
ncbi:MAG: penicillin-binding protein 2 [Moraxella sp.]|nr:penicillin-binding protein 2 [Moraxella sp.]